MANELTKRTWRMANYSCWIHFPFFQKCNQSKLYSCTDCLRLKCRVYSAGFERLKNGDWGWLDTWSLWVRCYLPFKLHKGAFSKLPRWSSKSSITLRYVGNSSISSFPIWGHCAPCPRTTKLVLRFREWIEISIADMKIIDIRLNSTSGFYFFS